MDDERRAIRSAPLVTMQMTSETDRALGYGQIDSERRQRGSRGLTIAIALLWSSRPELMFQNRITCLPVLPSSRRPLISPFTCRFAGTVRSPPHRPRVSEGTAGLPPASAGQRDSPGRPGDGSVTLRCSRVPCEGVDSTVVCRRGRRCGRLCRPVRPRPASGLGKTRKPGRRS
jgi:hypothetical protein